MSAASAAGEKADHAHIRREAVETLKMGLWLMLASAVAAALTYVWTSPIPQVAAGLCLAAGCMVAASAVERYQRVGG